MGASMRGDEKALLKAFSNSKEQYPRIRDIARNLEMPPKRLYYLVCKWSSKGYYEWGVVHDLGWLTDKGKAWATELGVKR
jgi:hypothetical protein